jgi:hypothetical protein
LGLKSTGSIKEEVASIAVLLKKAPVISLFGTVQSRIFF